MGISGSGDIKLSELETGSVKASISGSGGIVFEGGGPAADLTVAISG